MDDCGVIACSETEYFVHNLSTGQDRRSMSSLQSIFTLTDPSIQTCLSTISPVAIDGHSVLFKVDLLGTISVQWS